MALALALQDGKHHSWKQAPELAYESLTSGVLWGPGFQGIPFEHRWIEVTEVGKARPDGVWRLFVNCICEVISERGGWEREEMLVKPCFRTKGMIKKRRKVDLFVVKEDCVTIYPYWLRGWE